MGGGIKVTAKLVKKSKTNKGILLEGNDAWFSVAEKLISFVEKLNIGTLIEVTYIKKGTFQNVIGIYPAKESTEKEEPKIEEKKGTGFSCTECGAELKDDKYKKCYNCNKKAKENPPPEEKEPEKTKIFDEPEKVKKEWVPGNYNNPEKTAQIQRGNALNAAAAVVSNSSIQLEDKSPEALAEVTKVIAVLFLDWLRVE
jgi:hypothetical protein